MPRNGMKPTIVSKEGKAHVPASSFMSKILQVYKLLTCKEVVKLSVCNQFTSNCGVNSFSPKLALRHKKGRFKTYHMQLLH